MAVQKKTKPRKRVKPPRNPNVFNWTPQRKQAALLLSLGTKNYEEVAADVRVHYSTLWEWRKNPIFLAEVDRLTLENERATKAGLLRLAFKAIDKKENSLKDDKNTVLDWAEFVSGLQGIKTQKVEVDANIKGELDGARELLASRIAGMSARIRAVGIPEESNGQTGSDSEV